MLCAEARQLAAKGAEVTEVDASDAGQLRAAFAGAYGVFALTLSAAATGLPEERAQHEFEQGAATERQLCGALLMRRSRLIYGVLPVIKSLSSAPAFIVRFHEVWVRVA